MFSLNFECTIALCKFCKFCSILFIPLLFALHYIACAAFLVLVDKARVLCKCTLCSCSKANIFADAKCNFPWYFHLYCHLPFFIPAVRPCTIEDSAFTCTINCAMGSLPAAKLLHSTLFSLPPCYFGAYPLPFFFNLFRFTW